LQKFTGSLLPGKKEYAGDRFQLWIYKCGKRKEPEVQMPDAVEKNIFYSL
jgi:hypothetical protein